MATHTNRTQLACSSFQDRYCCFLEITWHMSSWHSEVCGCNWAPYFRMIALWFRWIWNLNYHSCKIGSTPHSTMPTWVTELYINSSNICLLEGDFAWQLNSYNTHCKGKNSNLRWRNQLGNWASWTQCHCPLYLQVTEMCGRRTFTTYLCTWVRIGCPGIPATMHLVRTPNQWGSQLPESCNDTFWILKSSSSSVWCEFRWVTGHLVLSPVQYLYRCGVDTWTQGRGSFTRIQFLLQTLPSIWDQTYQWKMWAWVKNPPLSYLF